MAMINFILFSRPSLIITLMQESCKEDGQLNDKDVYQGLTQLIKIFKFILATSQTITFQLIKQQYQCDKNIQHLKSVIGQNQSLIDCYNSQLDELSPHKITYFRFICRLVESLDVYKKQFYKQHIANTIYVGFLNKVQVLVNSFRLNKNIGRVFQKIFQLTYKFCNSCQIIMNKGSQEQAIEPFSKKKQIIKEEQEAQLQIAKKTSFNSTQSNFNKPQSINNRITNQIMKRFNPLSCLNLDYHFFKSSYFEAKSDNREIYKDMMQRNRFINSQIQIYSEQFQEYLRKKQRSINRKNRFKANQFNQTFTVGFKTKAKTIDVNKISQNQQQQAEKDSNRLQSLKQTKRNKLKDFESPQEVGFDFQVRKTTYEMKNVFLTLNKIHPNTQFNHISFHSFQKQAHKPYAVPKILKYEPKPSKFTTQEKAQFNNSLIQTVQIDFKSLRSKYQKGNMQKRQSFKNPTVYKNTEPILHKMERRNYLQRKNIRITQYLKKNSMSSKTKDNHSLNGIQGIHLQGQNFLQKDLS